MMKGTSLQQTVFHHVGVVAVVAVVAVLDSDHRHHHHYQHHQDGLSFTMMIVSTRTAT